jgi:glycosyltransferase involved in cell wall biosynthesis
MISDSQTHDESRIFLKEWIKSKLLSACRAAFVAGRRHEEYLTRLGFPSHLTVKGYDVVDNDYFARCAKEVRGQRSEVRQKYGLPKDYFLCVSRLIEKKNLFTLLHAYAEYRQRSEVADQKSEIWDLVLLGDGPLKSDLCRLISDLRLKACVQMPGFKQYDELPVYYALANVFVLASTTEQWGLAVNEAMAAALPVLVSERCGCAPELVHEGLNGFLFDPYNPSLLTDLMLRMRAGKCDLSAMGHESQRIIEHWSLDRFASGLWQAAEMACRSATEIPQTKYQLTLARFLLSLLLIHH